LLISAVLVFVGLDSVRLEYWHRDRWREPRTSTALVNGTSRR